MVLLVVNKNGMSGVRCIWFNHYNSHNLYHNVKIFADYDRLPGQKISGKGFSFSPYVVFVLVNKNAISRAHKDQQHKDPMPSDFF